MSGRRSRSKGARTERSIVNALQANGIAAVRVPLSVAVGGRFAGDIILSLMGVTFASRLLALSAALSKRCWLTALRRYASRSLARSGVALPGI